ncbi:histidine phosphatase family protein [Nodosilinea sp. FACHB-131]|uniref:histidine phosphatase family protein n=1 Tax=Cyanophyceae TaxID=3028117 RepID=UPI001685A978|nr:histidine phosphatase family protein [Nodosilinea sp. FACHB-131]MBD1873159.1 histidine phosphatase family protein [Nodosilinea sp. FACHB-131]
MPLRLYLLRNAETEYCRTGRYCSQDGVALSAQGQQMADYFAKAYHHLDWRAVFCSPLSHAAATVQPLCQITGLTVQRREHLRELSFGRWEGMAPAEVNTTFHDDYIRWLADPAWNTPTDGEKAMQVARRSSDVLAEIEEAYPDGNVLIVSHKATLRIMLCTLLGIDVGRYRDRLAMSVTAVSLVELMEYGPFVRQLNDRAHLPLHLRRPWAGNGSDG